jgi:hypothetical protein
MQFPRGRWADWYFGLAELGNDSQMRADAMHCENFVIASVECT